MGLTNTQYDTIMRDYQRQQAKDQQELSARQEEIYGKFPEFSEIDRKIASASTACARQLLSDTPAGKDRTLKTPQRDSYFRRISV